jgi:branched-chain amino acid transport system ATP-binding protein
LLILEIIDLCVSYGKAAILQGVSLALEEESVAAVLGPNGSGKTTLMRAIAGLVSWKGSIKFLGGPTNVGSPHENVRKGVVLCPERRRLFTEMTVIRNLEMGAYLRKNRKEYSGDLDRVFSLFPALKARSHNMAGNLSGGEQQMLAIARSLMSKPRLLMLDEPSFGLAPMVKKNLTDILKGIRRTNITILLSEQDAKMAFNTAGQFYLLENGKINIQGKRDEIINHPKIKKAYLGL